MKSVYQAPTEEAALMALEELKEQWGDRYTAVLKLLYLATQEVTRKWTIKIKHWDRILAQLSIHFGEQFGNLRKTLDRVVTIAY